ncbi:MAG: hypothetical protein KJS98_12325 [Nitrospirae bacterium]|nr:hypothetical protein [Nitrospirota bacterium]MDE3050104.1 hypothetical protein [Nitrospirota bacterium]MDE3220157.1 hypothetical protein [Nitrospirota bacterium]
MTAASRYEIPALLCGGTRGTMVGAGVRGAAGVGGIGALWVKMLGSVGLCPFVCEATCGPAKLPLRVYVHRGMSPAAHQPNNHQV